MKMQRAFLAVTLAALAAGCGSTSGDVLERIDVIQPPGSNLRVDVFVVTDVTSCAVGAPCRSADPDLCFHLTDAAGEQLMFRPEGLQFLPPGDPAVAQAEQAGCFRIGVEEAALPAIADAFGELRQQVFQLSEGDVHLDPRIHAVGPIEAGFKRWESGTGIFLEPTALEPVALSAMSRDTDFAFAITGLTSLAGSPLPKVAVCGGTNWQEQGALGGTAYTWVSMPCIEPVRLFQHLMVQSYFARRDVAYLTDIYADPRQVYDHNYPGCGQADPDPTRWFPEVADCARDPDWIDCGNTACRGGDQSAYYRHLFEAHWGKGRGLIGNHCQNGRADYDETSIDAGGVCDLLGR
jgi:hypothetical protein